MLTICGKVMGIPRLPSSSSSDFSPFASSIQTADVGKGFSFSEELNPAKAVAALIAEEKCFFDIDFLFWRENIFEATLTQLLVRKSKINKKLILFVSSWFFGLLLYRERDTRALFARAHIQPTLCGKREPFSCGFFSGSMSFKINDITHRKDPNTLRRHLQFQWQALLYY